MSIKSLRYRVINPQLEWINALICFYWMAWRGSWGEGLVEGKHLGYTCEGSSPALLPDHNEASSLDLDPLESPLPEAVLLRLLGHSDKK